MLLHSREGVECPGAVSARPCPAGWYRPGWVSSRSPQIRRCSNSPAGQWWLTSASSLLARGIGVLRWPVEPMQAAGRADLPSVPPAGELIYQPKWDGFRALAWTGGTGVALQSRHGRDLTRYFPDL